MASMTWFITGAGRGLGRAFVDGALAQGDRVVATARKPDELARALETHEDRALVLKMDVNDRASVHAAVERALEEMGPLDVVVNNAGYGLAGGIEEVSEEEARAQFDTNFFGALWVTQAVLPHMRERRSGHIIQISSVAGITAGTGLGLYSASKWALEAMSESLAGEVKPFGIKVTLVEPGGIRTDWRGDSMVRATPLADYDVVLESRRKAHSKVGGAAGDPVLAAQRIIELTQLPEPPLRLILGNNAFEHAVATLEDRLKVFAAWESVSRSTDRD
jgi:NAD(P)-dependent dehydrogenase (short-subunit alcohol dehydrogenase family)